MTEPTTEAGRALLEAYNGGSTFPIRDDILAIEAEARAAVLRELREEVEEMLDSPAAYPAPMGPTIRMENDLVRAVLAAIDRRLEPVRLSDATLMEVSIVHTDAAPGEMDDHGAWAFRKKEDR